MKRRNDLLYSLKSTLLFFVSLIKNQRFHDTNRWFYDNKSGGSTVLLDLDL